MFASKWKIFFCCFFIWVNVPMSWRIKEVSDWAQDVSIHDIYFSFHTKYECSNDSRVVMNRVLEIGFLGTTRNQQKMSLFLKMFLASQTILFINFCQSFRKYAKYQKILKWGKKQDWELCRTCIYIPKGRARTSFREA